MRFLREPVVHFALFGVFLFGYFYLVSDPEAGSIQASEIVVTDADVTQLIESYKSTWRRVPTSEELDTAITVHVRRQIMIREAQALGLDRGDPAIANRLYQKMQFLTDSMAQMLEPDDDMLLSFILDNPDRFTLPARLAFEQAYLGPSTSDQSVAQARAALMSGADPKSLGQASMIPASMSLSPHDRVDAQFGIGFAQSLQNFKAGEWIGPVRSGFGYHLVRVTERQPAAPLDLETYRERVVGAWREDQSKLLADAQYAALRERYDVALPDAERLKDIISQ